MRLQKIDSSVEVILCPPHSGLICDFMEFV